MIAMCLLASVGVVNGQRIELPVVKSQPNYTLYKSGFAPQQDRQLRATLIYDFEDGSLGDWTTIHNGDDNYTWGLAENEEYAYSGSYCLVSHWQDNPDEWLVSTDLPIGNDNPSISFYARAMNGYYTEHVGVFVSTTSSTDVSTFTQLNAWDVTSTTYSEYNVSLSSYAGQTIYVALRHFNSPDKYYLMVDDIAINLGQNVVAESVTISPTSANMVIGETFSFTAKVLPSTANQAVTWSSSNTSILSIDANGVATANAAGTATITVTSVDGGFTATSNVTVTDGILFDFESDPTEGCQAWTFVDSDGDGYNWNWEMYQVNYDYQSAFAGDGLLSSASYSTIALTPNNWAISPAINITGANAQVQLYAAGQDPAYAAEVFQIYAGTSPEVSAMTAVSSKFTATGAYEAYTGDLSAYNGQTIYVAVRHYDVTDMFRLNVDQMTVTHAVLSGIENTGISLDQSSATVYQGLTLQLTATIETTATCEQSLTWTSSNTAIATVSASGLVTGVAVGTATITVATADGLTAQCVVRVASNPIEYITVNDGNATNSYIPVYGLWTDSWQHTQFIQPEVADLTEMIGRQVVSMTFSTTTETINSKASGDWAGDVFKVTIAPIEATTYESADFITLPTDAVQVYSGSLSVSNYEMVVTFDEPFTYNGGNLLIDFEETTHNNYKSCSFKGANPGQDVYTSVYQYSTSSVFRQSFLPEIKFAYIAEEPVAVESITADDVNVTVGATATITPTVLPEEANQNVTYESANEAIATVSAEGLVTGVADGTTTITITSVSTPEVSTTINVTVTSIAVTSITADDVTMMNGETATINYTVAPDNATNPAVTFASANEAIATVDETGVVTSHTIGETTITITSVSNPEATATINVTVTADPNAVQFTVVAPATAKPGDIIEVEAHIAAPTSGEYNGFTGLVLALYFDPAAFAVNGNPTPGPVANAATIAMPQLPNATYPNAVQYSMTNVPGNPVTTTGLVFSMQFTVLTNAELGNYSFYAEPTKATNFVYNPASSAQPIPYEVTPTYVEIALSESMSLTIEGYGEGDGNYYLIASPLTEAVEASAIENLLYEDGYDLYYYDQTQELEWINYKAGAFQIEPGKGYLYARKDTEDITFTGTLQKGTDPISVALVYGANDPNLEGFNLIGNPFAVDAYLNMPFYVMNEAGTEVEATTETVIAPMQGVFVQATAEGQSAIFSTESSNGKGNITLSITQGRSNIDKAIVSFNGDKLQKFMLNQNHSKIYVPQNGKDYAVANAEEDGEMPINFKATSNGTYTINVNVGDAMFSYLHLIDNLTGADVDLLENPNYSFNAQITDYDSRFKIVFTQTNTSVQSFAYYTDGNLFINNDGEYILEVIDVTGRILSSETVNGNYNKQFNVTPGVYMLRMTNGSETYTQKIVVK